MKSLLNYVDKMSDKRYLYCETVLELVKRGYRYSQATHMVIGSGILDETDDDYGWMMFHNMGPNEWANIVIRNMESKKSYPDKEEVKIGA